MLGLFITGLALGSFLPKIDNPTSLVWAQVAPPWPEPLVANTVSLLEQEGHAKALQHYQQMLELSSQSSFSKADILFQIGFLHEVQADWEAALAAYQQSLQILETLPSPATDPRRAELWVLVGWLFRDLGDFEQAAVSLETGISLYRDLQGNNEAPVRRLGDALYVLGRLKDTAGELADAIALYQEAYDIFDRLNDVQAQLRAAILIGGIHTNLGNYAQAYRWTTAALDMSRTAEKVEEEAELLTLLGFIQRLRQRYDSAIDYYQQALSLKDETASEDTALLWNNLGYAYLQDKNFTQARASLTRAVEQLMPAGEQQAANIFDTFGDLHVAERAYEPAWESYTVSLRLSRSLEERIGQILTWINLAQLLVEQKQPAVAISFYKQAINHIEQIRDNVRSLPLETQQRYTETVADSYRELAALLFEQERVFEAQQVLDLLKIQELEDYLHDVRAEQPNIAEKLPYLAPERIVLEQHQTLLLQGQSDADSVLSLSEFLQHPAVADALETLEDNSDLKPDSLKQLQQKLNTLPHQTAVLYPLILEDRLELLLISAEGTPIHTTTWLAKHRLTKQVNTLRNNLSDPSSDVKAVASSLYDAIIAPLNEDLKRLDIENIIYIPDGVLHYIPLSVLYNRVDNRWLTEDYTTHNLTASDVGDLTHPPQRPISVLAGAFTDTSQTFEKLIGQKTTNFNGLLYAGREVSQLQETLPETEILLDAEFNRANLETQLNGQTIVHLATHAAFVPGQPENSFVLLGDGDTITLKELRHWSLPNVDLVVLSACQTGISHIEEGVEILGMGFQVQRTEARAALASLWWVDDRATSQLMELFYNELIKGNTKAQALQNAQRQLIAQGKNEPYYWAPFVLIGNGL